MKFRLFMLVLLWLCLGCVVLFSDLLFGFGIVGLRLRVCA